MMSHELRTPLNAIGGFAELLAMGVYGELNPTQAEQIGRIQRSGQHLLSLINNVLNYARIEAGQMQYEMCDIAIANLLADVAPLLAPQIRAKGISYHVRCDTANACIHADRDKLGQIILNLLTNAIKFTPTGGTIKVDASVTPTHVHINVEDTGVGIKQDDLQRVFEPFVQVGRSLTTTTQGTGLGLAISRDLARTMGGDITAESTVGRGSIFTVVLPRSPNPCISDAVFIYDDPQPHNHEDPSLTGRPPSS
jgi:signal transduction histidine kinase